MTKTKLIRIITNVICLLAIIASLVLIILRYSQLPDRIPTNFDFSGNVTGYGSKGMLWVLPVLNLLIFVPMAAAELFPGAWNTGVNKRSRNYALSLRLSGILLTIVKTASVLFISALTIIVTLGLKLPPWLTILFVLVLAGTMIWYFVRLAASNRR